MELRCPVSFSSPSLALSSIPLKYSTDIANPSNTPQTAGWPGCYCRIVMRGGSLHCLRRNLVPNSILKHSLRPAIGSGSARGKGLANTRLDKLLTSRLPPARLFSVLSWSKGELALRQGKSNRRIPPFVCKVKFESEQDVGKGQDPGIGQVQESGQLVRVGQVACWVASVMYVGWLFLLPYAPGDPVWSISPSTIQMLTDLSLNFFFVLPIASSLSNVGASFLARFIRDFGMRVLASMLMIAYMIILVSELDRAAGFDGLRAPVLHPTAEALFNFVLGWTLLFAPLLFTDKKRDRFGGSLETLWVIQMFLTNTVLAPYMAIRQNSSPADRAKASPLSSKLDILSRGMTTGAYTVGIMGALVGLISLFWAFVGRQEAGFGGLDERWEYFLNYVASERLAYAFLWDIALYTFFQPWLIGDNLDNVTVERRELVRFLRFVPYVGLVAYVLGLQIEDQGVSND